MSREVFYLDTAASSIWPRRTRVRKSSALLRRSLRFGHDDTKWKVFYSAAVASLIRPWWCRVEKYSTRSWRCLQFGHDEAKLETVLLDHGGVSGLPAVMLSRKVFDSAATTSPIQPWWCWLGKSAVPPWRYLWFSHDEVESESVLLSRGGVSDLAAVMCPIGHGNVESKSVLHGRGRVSDLVAVMCLIWLWRCWVGKPSTRSWRHLWFGRYDIELESPLLSYSNVSDSTMTRPSQKVF